MNNAAILLWRLQFCKMWMCANGTVRPIIVHGVLGIEYLSSAAESSPSDHNAPISESDTKFSYHGNFLAANVFLVC